MWQKIRWPNIKTNSLIVGNLKNGVLMSRDHTQEAENEQCIDKPSQLYDQNHWLIIKKNMAPKLHNW
jgi:hypothetical protein